MQIHSNFTDSAGFGFLNTLSGIDSSASFASLISERALAGQEQKSASAGSASSSGAQNREQSQQERGQTRPSPETTAKLESALGGTIDYLADKFGNAAATTAMGIILKRVGSDQVTEKSLGDGFLSAIKFVDQQFGIAEGDQFINQLNGDLNEGVNAFFDNGLNEKFMASTTVAGNAPITGAALKKANPDISGNSGLVADLKGMLENLQKNRIGENAKPADESNMQYKKYTTPYFEAPSLEPGLVVDAMI